MTVTRRCSTPEMEAQVIAAYNERGATLKTVGQRFAMDHSTVRAILIRNGVPRHRWGGSRKHPVDVELALMASELYGEGLSLEEVGALLHCSRGVVRRMLVENGTPRRSRSEAQKAAYRLRRGRTDETHQARQPA